MGTTSELYVGRLLRVDLTTKRTSEEVLSSEIMRNYVGGTGIGARILYDEVPPGTAWSDAENRLILTTGPLAGTRMGGSGTFSVVTKGCLTNGGTSSQANGYLGAYLRFNGLIGIILQGASDSWVYLHIKDGVAELKNAEHLVGLDTWETEAAIKKELAESEHGASVHCIGPAGENLIKFAGIIGDRGHIAAHNGCGAVMGSKKLKAVAVSRGKSAIPVNDTVSLLAKQIHESIVNDPNPIKRDHYEWGTSHLFPPMLAGGQLPVKNMNTNLFPGHEKFLGENYRKEFKLTPKACWACRMHHLHMVEVTQGPYAGYVAEEPEYESWAAWGPLIGQNDLGAAVMLSDVTDRLGMDCNEAGWIMGFLMDCYQRGIISRADTDGLEMVWGNAEAVRAMLYRIAKREGFGNVLAEGLKRAAEKIGGDALNYAVYVQKGHAPRGHDHRARWTEVLDNATSNTGTIETGPTIRNPPEMGLDPFTDPFSPDQVPYMVARSKTFLQFVDCLGICVFTAGSSLNRLIEIVNAATGWDMTLNEVTAVVMRNVNVLRAFNIRHGVSTQVEAPSVLYSSVPTDGPAKGKDIKPHWDHMIDVYYRHMGWDKKSGKPLPETLRSLGLEQEIRDLW